MRASGRIRPARRPADWRPPGPPPSPPPDSGPGPGEDLCWLAGDWRILQRRDGHRWSLDDLVTAWFAARAVADSPPRTHLDLGCGIGAVLLLVAWRFPALRAVGVEAQAVSIDLAGRSVAWNGIDGRARVVLGDLRDASVLPPDAAFELVTGTPPYLAPGTATASTRIQRGPCHFAYRGGIADYCLAAGRWLAPAGRFVVCEAAAHVARVETAAARAGLIVERRLDVIPREGKGALFSVYGMRRTGTGGPGAPRGSRSRADAGVGVSIVAGVGRAPTFAARGPRSAGPEPTVEAPLVVRDGAGRWTAEFAAVRREMGLPPGPPQRPVVG